MRRNRKSRHKHSFKKRRTDVNVGQFIEKTFAENKIEVKHRIQFVKIRIVFGPDEIEIVVPSGW